MTDNAIQIFYDEWTPLKNHMDGDAWVLKKYTVSTQVPVIERVFLKRPNYNTLWKLGLPENLATHDFCTDPRDHRISYYWERVPVSL